MEYFVIVELLILFITNIETKPIVTASSAMEYLSQYGWLDSDSSRNKFSLPALKVRRIVKEFQGFAGLRETGELDAETIRLMNLPRCGVRDKIGRMNRGRRYALQGSRWKIRNLTYAVTKYPMQLSQSEVDTAVKDALKIWKRFANISFRKFKGKGRLHIEIKFEKTEHGDEDPFDGPGGQFAHAFYPKFGGDVHLDADETWTLNSSGINLQQTVAHEIGHALIADTHFVLNFIGLSHSRVRSSLMAPFYHYRSNLTLHPDDTLAIRLLYGAQKSVPRKMKEMPLVESKTDQPPEIPLDEMQKTENEEQEKMDETNEEQEKMDDKNEEQEKMDETNKEQEKRDEANEEKENMDEKSEDEEKMDEKSEDEEKMAALFEDLPMAYEQPGYETGQTLQSYLQFASDFKLVPQTVQNLWNYRPAYFFNFFV